MAILRPLSCAFSIVRAAFRLGRIALHVNVQVRIEITIRKPACQAAKTSTPVSHAPAPVAKPSVHLAAAVNLQTPKVLAPVPFSLATEYIATPASSSRCSVATSPVSASSTCATADWLSPSTPRCSTSQWSLGSIRGNSLYDSDGSEDGLEEDYELEQCRRSLEGAS
ncbi:hypothetical protein TSOC_009559 [Tetrabaena socialis]|uniref:Uncharacterized protein n=1 Tax=Tetrabaena socialis TaxID=47790 RepID=A0A2J7ZVJ6_9CHLO|nr:hypothetical protein TSOC_009559 [Tetrabaena socialis]|eukprot:PNH04292.1 hypothetical protein TSOC_009559 [Tetrabaena socialis]